MNLHALNNEGAEGNTMMTRMVDIIDQKGQKRTVNAVSGDMFKHIFVEHLIGEARTAGLPLCLGCQSFSANRICSPDEPFLKEQGWTKETPDSTILSAVLARCLIDDCAGILITSEIGKARSIARKSCVEFGWVVGRPESTTTESYFHAKYVPEGRGKGSGEGENTGQNIFHRPASSGQYAVNVNVDLYKIGRNDITLLSAIGDAQDSPAYRQRAGAALRGLLSTFLKPTGAHRNTQNPHIVDFEGVITTSTTTVPAPSVSALNPDYRGQVRQIVNELNSLYKGGGLELAEFNSLGTFTQQMATKAVSVSVPRA